MAHAISIMRPGFPGSTKANPPANATPRLIGYRDAVVIRHGPKESCQQVSDEVSRRQGEALDFVANDFHARVIQHETDHLKGEVYLDRMTDMKTLSHLPEWQRYVIEPAARKS